MWGAWHFDIDFWLNCAKLTSVFSALNGIDWKLEKWSLFLVIKTLFIDEVVGMMKFLWFLYCLTFEWIHGKGYVNKCIQELHFWYFDSVTYGWILRRFFLPFVNFPFLINWFSRNRDTIPSVFKSQPTSWIQNASKKCIDGYLFLKRTLRSGMSTN